MEKKTIHRRDAEDTEGAQRLKTLLCEISASSASLR